MWQDDQKYHFKTAERMVKTNENIINDHCIRSDAGVLAVSEEYKKTAWKSNHMNLLNTEVTWDRKSLSQADTVSRVPCLIDKDMLRESINKIKNGRIVGPSSVLLEMVKVAGEVRLDMITDLVNQIIEVILEKLSPDVQKNCSMLITWH